MSPAAGREVERQLEIFRRGADELLVESELEPKVDRSLETRRRRSASSSGSTRPPPISTSAIPLS